MPLAQLQKALTLQGVFDLITHLNLGDEGTGQPGILVRRHQVKRATLLMQVRDEPAGGSRATG